MARKKSTEPTKTARIAVKMYPKEKQEAETKARKNYMTLSTYIRHLIRLDK